MSTYKVSELDGPFLDEAVAKANGWKEWKGHAHMGMPVWLTGEDESPTHAMFSPSTQWRDGGPIIERERIAFHFVKLFGPNPVVRAECIHHDSVMSYCTTEMCGPSHLVAAMRAYVASRFGDEVELP